MSSHLHGLSFDSSPDQYEEEQHMLADLSSLSGDRMARRSSTPRIVEPSRSLSRSSLARSRSGARKRVTYHQASTPSLSGSFSAQYTPPLNEGAVGLGIAQDAQHRPSFDSGLEAIDVVERDEIDERFASRESNTSFGSSTHLLSSQLPPHLPDRRSVSSQRSFAEFAPHCPSRKKIWKPASNHVYITLLVLSIFSTALSTFYLILALWRPEYGKFVASSGGNLTPSTASVLFNLFAKLIELSFLTVFIAFVGQVISRRAFNKSPGYGITLAELSMRSWIMQPGTILTHLSSVKAVLFSLMGVLSLFAALSALFYTTAASALVEPQMSQGHFVDRTFYGNVKTTFANVSYIQSQCQPADASDADGDTQRQLTCLDIALASTSLNDFSSWSAQWNSWRAHGHSSTDLKTRPPPTAQRNENTTVTGSWIEVQDMQNVSQSHGRWVNNVTLAMPHSGVVSASSDPSNHLLQPEDDDGSGAYDLHASVMSPALNVMCVNMSADEMTPMVYANWSGVNTTGQTWLNWTEMVNDPNIIPPYGGPDQWLNATVVDSLFQLGPDYGQRRMPVFPHLPQPYNTILNGTGAYAGRDTLWLLGAPPTGVPGYALCSIRAFQTPACSTWYNATRNGNTLLSLCEDDEDSYQYSRLHSNAPQGNATDSLDWTDLGEQWAVSTTLNAGITDDDASDARSLAEMIPTSYSLPAGQPSIAEALAVMGGGTLLKATADAPYDGSTDTGPSPIQVTVRSQQYASGAQQGWQNILFVVLFSVVGGNVLCLGWLISTRGLITDYCDPANLFALGINSPPSYLLAGSCGGGPSKAQYRVRWFLNVDNDHVFLENAEQETARALSMRSASSEREGPAFKAGPSPIMLTFSRLSKRKSIL